jgi:C4-dicarboxylate transporter/malic acid transport protein
MANRYNDSKKDIERLGVYDVPPPSHVGGHGHGHHAEVDPSTVDWRERLKHMTFAWYASTMSTGGVAFTMSVIPNQQAMPWLRGLGTGMFVINIIAFLIITTMMIIRFMMHPGTLKHALSNPHEGFFFATFWLTIATMITNSTAYGIPATGKMLIEPLRIAFWIYLVCASILAIVYYHVLFTVKKLVITNVLPGWLLPVFPAMLVGTLASAIAKTQPPEQAYPMLIAGLTYQGLGMMMAMMIYAIYLGRLLTSGLPIDMSRPAMFIAVGPPSFTALALIGMSQDAVDTQVFTQYTTLPFISNPAIIYDVMQIGSLLAAIFLWMLAFWFFSIAVIATFEAIYRNDFHLNWYAYVFPNVGFTIATIQIGNRLASNGIQIVGTVMAGILFFLLLIIMFAHVKAFFNRMICWPGKDEDAH